MEKESKKLNFKDKIKKDNEALNELDNQRDDERLSNKERDKDRAK